MQNVVEITRFNAQMTDMVAGWARSARAGNKAITANHDRLPKDDDREGGDEIRGGQEGPLSQWSGRLSLNDPLLLVRTGSSGG